MRSRAGRTTHSHTHTRSHTHHNHSCASITKAKRLHHSYGIFEIRRGQAHRTEYLCVYELYFVSMCTCVCIKIICATTAVASAAAQAAQ